MNDFTGQWDQIGAHLRDFTPILSNYLDALVTKGFKRQEAFLLVRDYHSIWWQTTFMRPIEDEGNEE